MIKKIPAWFYELHLQRHMVSITLVFCEVAYRWPIQSALWWYLNVWNCALNFSMIRVGHAGSDKVLSSYFSFSHPFITPWPMEASSIWSVPRLCLLLLSQKLFSAYSWFFAYFRCVFFFFPSPPLFKQFFDPKSLCTLRGIKTVVGTLAGRYKLMFLFVTRQDACILYSNFKYLYIVSSLLESWSVVLYTTNKDK